MKKIHLSVLLSLEICVVCSAKNDWTASRPCNQEKNGQTADKQKGEGLTPENELLAFPTAEGYGKNTVGGRGGTVYEVTNLNDSGEGSLRAAIEANGPRTVIFRVSGTIDLKSNLCIRNPYITIAGQTAPGDGICLKRYSLQIGADEVIIRYIRVRPGDESGVELDAISGRYKKNIILDHISASWSVDETLSLYHCENVTIQWCMATESMYMSVHGKGNHGFGGIWGSNYSTYHHNLLAHHSSRNPRWASGCGHNDYRNNVLYNWGYNSSYGGEIVQSGNQRFNGIWINYADNYFKPGPATLTGNIFCRILSPSGNNEQDCGKWYVAGNVVEGNEAVSADNWNGGAQPAKGDAVKPYLKLDQPWDAMKINTQSAKKAYEAVLKDAGCSLPVRDAVDKRIVDEVRNGNATYEGPTYKEKHAHRLGNSSVKCGIIDTQTDVGGWPELKSAEAPVDSDHDGMPDEWETAHGLNPKNAADGAEKFTDGYTYLEKYLHTLGR